MKRSRALLFAFGVPALYIAVQSSVQMAVVMYYYIIELTRGVNPAMLEPDDITDMALRVMNESLSVTIPIMIAASALFLFIMMLSYRHKPYSVWNAVGMSRNITRNVILTSALAGFSLNMMCVGLISVAEIPDSWNQAHDTVTDMLMGSNMFLSVMFTVLLAPFIEEIVFRGFTQRYLQKVMPGFSAALISGLVFGLTHFNWLQTFYAFLLGVILGLIYSWMKNLWSTIALHASFNGANFLLTPILFIIYGEVETIPDIAAAVMIALGAVLSLYSITRLYKIRPGLESESSIAV